MCKVTERSSLRGPDIRDSHQLIALRSDQIFVSWNGATECMEWVLQGSGVRHASEHEWGEIVRVPKAGFRDRHTCEVACKCTDQASATCE